MTNTTDKAMREAFEAWATDQGYSITQYNNTYIERSAAHAWFGYRAALASSAAAPEQADLTDEADAPALWAEIFRLRSAVQGPQGFATWQDAATAERLRRVKAEQAFAAATQAQPAPAAEAPSTQDGEALDKFMPVVAHLDGVELVRRSDAVAAIGNPRLRPSAPLSEGSHRIDGLGRMTDDDDGFVTLQFVSEAAAEAFMARYEPTVDVDAMPPPSPQPTKEAMADLIRTAGHVTRSHAKMIADVLHAALSSPASSAGVDAQRLDAERYRWLRREVHGPRLPLAQVVWKQDGIRASSQWTNLCDGSSLDEHIDAAIASKEQP